MKKRWLVGILLVLMALSVTAIGGAVAYVYQTVEQLDIKQLSSEPVPPTVIYDKEEQLIAELSIAKSEPIAFDKIPSRLIQAVVATEDRRFYDHVGIDWIGILRAGWVNFRAGQVLEGGSSITQQLVKNAFLSSERTMDRKIQEAFGAVQMERTYSKDQIITLYLNTIYFGEGAWGVQRAAQIYFGKSVDELTLPEVALLAALPKAPNHYSPFKDAKRSLERRNLVLHLMQENGYITAKEHDQASEAPLPETKHEINRDIKHPSFVYQVIRELKQHYKISEDEVWGGGLKIYTTMDRHLQDTIEKLYQNNAHFPKSADGTTAQSGAVVLDVKTGEIQALMAGRGEIPYLGFHRATDLKRQPGSSIKPVVVYGPALEQGYHPDSMLYDKPLDIAGYQPQNWDRSYRGEVTLQEAVNKSWNIPAVWLLHQMGIDQGLNFAKKLGIPFDKDDRVLPVALGGMKHGVSPLHMAQAYAAFANQGLLHEAHTIKAIYDYDDQEIAIWEASPHQVMKKETALLMSHVLQGVLQSGTGARAAIGRPAAGKTGTTQLPPALASSSNGLLDSWFVGYTPQLSAAVWIGYDSTTAQHHLPSDGGRYSALLWKEIMQHAHQGLPAEAFPQPPAWKKPELLPAPPVVKRAPQPKAKKDKRSEKKKEEKGRGKGKRDD
ncbi:transglycosylase domain-containing protein [Ammoniphilus sp. CFH 90114]|uniref:transglycosylase domain-containing protein n=1 Tax=Ammoniphilus sp. CFH 90114 TaxID=2493665 RepID=UPI0013E94BAC|nr:PBP1A family penicillin-binding protein [Ammoniphilus sp. CFH 90114]